VLLAVGFNLARSWTERKAQEQTAAPSP